ncbi:MAG: hypothetical protein QW599_05605 [Nitrososphaerota archaeon]
MKIYLFRSGTINYVAYARSIDEAAKKFIKYLVDGELPDGSTIGLLAEIRELSEKTGEPVGNPCYCLAAPFLVAAGLLSPGDFAKLLEPLGLDAGEALILAEIAKHQLASMRG